MKNILPKSRQNCPNKKNCLQEDCACRAELAYYVNKHLEEAEKWKLIFSLTKKTELTLNAKEYFAELINEMAQILPVGEISLIIYENNMNNLIFSYGSGEGSEFLNNVIFKHYRYFDVLDELNNILKFNFLLIPIRKVENDLGYIFFRLKNPLTGDINTLFTQAMCEHIAFIAQQMHTTNALQREITEIAKSFAEFSHELKTPLNAIIGYSDLLKEKIGSFDDKTAEYILNINTGSRQLKSLMTDIIESTKIRNGRASITMEDFCTKSTILSVLDVFSSKINEKDLSVETILMDVSICSDLTKFNQVLYNAVSNCVKFCPKGGKVRVVTWCDNDNFYFEINNEGTEISPNEIEDVFKFLSQASSSAPNNREGSGIGLSICKKVIEMQGGKINMVSNPESGTTFSFQLPLNQ